MQAGLGTTVCVMAGLWLTGCGSEQPRDPTLPVEQLAARLASCKLTHLATALAMDPQVSEVWQQFPDARSYVALVDDARWPIDVRFAAALMLRSTGEAQLKRADPHAVAEVFAAALQHNLAGYAFSWGWLWAPGDPLGLLGQVFIEIGPPAERALEPLLDDATARDTYLGSTEATEMAGRRYRVKDFAAFYLARLANLELPWEPDLAKRDQVIGKLRVQLAAEAPPGEPQRSVGVVGASAALRLDDHCPQCALRGGLGGSSHRARNDK